ncbi:MAG: hypothetical protein AAFO07_07790 [Bacteroidota bacterium]
MLLEYLNITAKLNGNSGPPLHYSITNGLASYQQNGGLFENLTAGTYDVRVAMDAAGTCAVSYGTVNLNHPIVPEIRDIIVTQLSACNANDGSIEINTTTSGSLEFSIDGGTTYQQSNLFAGLIPGVYEVLVRSTSSQCVTTSSSSIELLQPCIEICGNDIDDDGDLLVDCDDPDCENYASCQECVATITNLSSDPITDCSSGYFRIHVSGLQDGDVPQYSINGGVTWSNDFFFTITEEQTIAATDIMVIINNPTYTQTCTLTTELGDHTISFLGSTTPLNVDLEVIDAPPCADVGQVQVKTLSGQGPFEIRMGTTVLDSDASEGEFFSLPLGEHLILIYQTAVNGNLNLSCYEQQTVNITKEDLPEIRSVSTTPAVNCNGNTDNATLEISAQSPTNRTLSYSIDNGLSWQDDPIFTGLNPGNYEVAVKNQAEDCSIFSRQTVTVSSLPEITSNGYNITGQSTCTFYNGSIEVLVNNTSDPMIAVEYSIDNGSTWSVNPVFSQLEAGTYTVFVRYLGASCSNQLGNVEVPLEEPQVTFELTTAAPSICNSNDGQLNLASVNGYEFLRNSYQVSLDNQRWYPADEHVFENLSPGNYNVFIRRSDQDYRCFIYSQSVELTGPSLTISDVQSTDPNTCESDADNGIIIVNAEVVDGIGNETLHYSIDGGQTYQSGNNQFDNLQAGNYTVYVALSNNGDCAISYGTITLTASTVPMIREVVKVNPTICDGNDGKLTIYTTELSNWEYSIDNGNTYQASNQFENLTKGNYRIKVRYAGSNCEADYLLNPVELTDPCTVDCMDDANCGDPYCQPGPYSVQVNQIETQEDGSQTQGSVQVNIADPIKYAYQLEASYINYNEEQLGDPLFRNLEVGTYTLKVRKQGNECWQMYTQAITIEDDMAQEEECPDPSCIYPDCDCNQEGVVKTCQNECVTIGIENADDSYCYKWLPEEGLKNPYAAQTEACPETTTTYTLYITNNEGDLVQELEVTVEVYFGRDLEITIDEPLTCTEDAQLRATIDLLSYEWKNEGNVIISNERILTVSKPGKYTVSAVDKIGCPLEASIDLAPPYEVKILPEDPLLCLGSSIELEAQVEGEGYSFSWSNNDQTTTTIVDVPDTYRVTVDDGSGCKVVEEIEVKTSNDENIKAKLEQLGFHFLAVDNVSEVVGFGPLNEDETINDYAQLYVELSGQTLNPKNIMADVFQDDYFQLGASLQGMITSNNTFCTEGQSFESIRANFESADMAFWQHICWDEVNGEGGIYSLSNVPHAEAHFPTTNEQHAYLEGLLAILPDQPLYDFSNKEEQKLHVYLDAFADNVVTYEMPSEENNPQQNGIVSIALSGVAVSLDESYKPQFFLRDKLKDRVDSRALTGFYIEADNSDPLSPVPPQLFRGLAKIETGYFLGYKDYFKKDGEYYDFTIPEMPAEILLGQRTECINVYQKVQYHTDLVDTHAEGAFQKDFAVSGTFLSVPGQPEIEMRCLPNITYDEFENPDNIYIHFFENGDYAIKIYIGEDMLFVYQPIGTNDEYFYRWNRIDKQWVSFTPPSEPQEQEFVSAFLQACGEVVAANKHELLDLVGLIPCAGETADAVNMQLYIIEGDTENAILAGVSLIPITDIVTKSYKYGKRLVIVIRNGIKAKAAARRISKQLKKVTIESAGLVTDLMGEIYDLEKLTSGQKENIISFYSRFLNNNANDEIALLFYENPNLIKSWKQGKDLGMSDETLEVLFKDLAAANNGDDLIGAFVETPGLVKAWKETLDNGIDVVIRRNPYYLTSLSKFPFGTGKKKIVDEATDDDFIQLLSGKLKDVPDQNPSVSAMLKDKFGPNTKTSKKFDTDPSAKEFDAITDDLLIEHKSLTSTNPMSTAKRTQMKYQVRSCKALGKDNYLIFE